MTYELRVEALVPLGVDLRKQVGVERQLSVVWEDDVGLKVPELYRESA